MQGLVLTATTWAVSPATVAYVTVATVAVTIATTYILFVFARPSLPPHDFRFGRRFVVPIPGNYISRVVLSGAARSSS